MTIDKRRYSKLLAKVAEDLDIPPSKYRDAVERYQAVGRWLEAGEYPCAGTPDIYPQGSFRLGTVVRPIRHGVESDYDIDLVCQLPIPRHLTDAGSVKLMVGQRINEHDVYRQMRDKEGKRCWTLQYAEKDGIGFHLDILPAVPKKQSLSATAISITNKDGNTYRWSTSDPKGYAYWFDQKNRRAFDQVQWEQKQLIQSRAAGVYASVEDVPDQLVRTPLQRTIQIFKRHRDSKFNGSQRTKHAPISIIITTLTAQLYSGELDVFSALSAIVSKLHAFASLVDSDFVHGTSQTSNLISRTPDGKWYIGNPVNPEENFADRWHEDNHARARSFFWWVASVKKDLVDIVGSGSADMARSQLIATLGASVVANHIGLIVPAPATPSQPPRVTISRPARPWGPNARHGG